MQTISADSFAMVCFLVLMESGDGVIKKAPIYLAEKTRMLQLGYDAFAYLDIYNMRKIILWCNAWKVKVPDVIQKEYNLQEDAATEL